MIILRMSDQRLSKQIKISLWCQCHIVQIFTTGPCLPCLWRQCCINVTQRILFLPSYSMIIDILFSILLMIRCVSLCFPQVSQYLSSRTRTLICILTWVYNSLCTLPPILGWYGEFGYNKRMRRCDYIKTGEKVHPRTLFFSLAFTIPLCMICVSYLKIWLTVTTSSSHLKPKWYSERDII